MLLLLYRFHGKGAPGETSEELSIYFFRLHIGSSQKRTSSTRKTERYSEDKGAGFNPLYTSMYFFPFHSSGNVNCCRNDHLDVKENDLILY